MGIFDNVSDVTGQLKAEALDVTVTFQPGVPNPGQGTITWNIPGPVVETVDPVTGDVTITNDPTGSTVVYGGIVLVLKEGAPLNHHNIPKDGVTYVPDPTADPTLFAGDKIGDGLVVGAIYESVQKAQGKPLTTSLVINDIDDSAAYYICGYIHDDQLRYYQEGNRTYSQAIGNENGRGEPARQVVQLWNTQVGGPTPPKFGVKPTDGTGLVAGATYQFELIYDDHFPHPDERNLVRMFFSFDGSVAPTYAHLLKYLNEQIAIKCTNAVQSPVPPSAGVYYWDKTNKKLYQWDGMELVLIPNVIVQATDPTNPPVGSYWWNTTNNMLYIWTGLQYVLVQPQYAFPVDPTTIQSNAYWWNGVDGFTRCGNTWCETDTIVSTTDPSCPIAAIPCAYWYDTATQILYNWNGTNWVQAYALMWPFAPTALPGGTLWFDLNTNKLATRDSQGPIATFGSLAQGSGYVQGTYTNVPLNLGGHGTGAQATIVVGNVIKTAPVTTGGTAYNNNIDQQYYNVPLTGGSGTGATANLLVVSGTIIEVVITNGGINYNVADVLSVNNANLGGTGSGFTATVATVTGGVVSVVLTAPGTNYIIGDALTTNGANLGSATGSGFQIDVATLAPSASNTWISTPVIISTVDPTTTASPVVAGTYWYNSTTEVLAQRNNTNTAWAGVPVLVWAGDPTIVTSCELWWDESTNPATLFQWDFAHSTWDPVSAFYQQPTDPNAPPVLVTGTLWWNPNNNTLLLWNGSSWTVINFFTTPFDPTMPPNGTAWFNTTNNTWYIWGQPMAGKWNPISPTISATDPSMPAQGSFWFDTATNVLYQRVGNQWIPIPYVTTPPSNMKGQTWYNLTTHRLMEWNGKAWVFAVPCLFVKLDRGMMVFETTGRGSNFMLLIPIPAGVANQPSSCITINTGQLDYVNDSNSPYQNYPLGGFGNSYNCYCAFETPGSPGKIRYRALPINPQGFLFSHLKPHGALLRPLVGRDGVDGTPTYDQLGVGTTGSPAERRQLMSEVQKLLGSSGVTVELDESQLDLCVTNALADFRRKSSLAVQRNSFFLDIVPYKQNYILADKAVGFNKIVAVMAGYRFTSAFLSSAYGAGVYGQVVLQHLYNMGTFDLLSYHLVSQYVEQLEILFSTRLVFNFNETTRELQIYQSFNRPERILLDVVIEKTEQEIFQNRYAHRWIQQFALAEACDILANLRGKFGNLPGAGGAVTLNASDLRAQAQDIRTRCQEEIDDYTVQNVEDFGAYGSIAIG